MSKAGYQKRIFIGGPADGHKLEVPYSLGLGEFTFYCKDDMLEHRYRPSQFHVYDMLFTVMRWVPMDDKQAETRVNELIRKALVGMFCDTDEF